MLLVEHLPALRNHGIKSFLPSLLELCPSNESSAGLVNPNAEFEGGRISTYPHLLLNFAHFPYEFEARFEFKVLLHELIEYLADLSELSPHRLGVKLEGVVHNTAVVESEYLQFRGRVGEGLTLSDERRRVGHLAVASAAVVQTVPLHNISFTNNTC